MNFDLPDNLDLAPLQGLIQTPSGQLWTAPNEKLSLSVTPQLTVCAKSALAHFRSDEVAYVEHFARLVEIAVGLLPADAQAMVEDYFRRWASERLVPLGHLHLLAFTDYTPMEARDMGTDDYQEALDCGWRELLNVAGVPLEHPDLFVPQPQRIDHEALMRHYTIRGLYRDWDDYMETKRRGWLKGKLIPIVIACADELEQRLKAQCGESSGSGCTEPFDPTSTDARQNLGEAVYNRLDPDDGRLPEFPRVRTLMSPNETAQVFNNAVILLILRYS